MSERNWGQNPRPSTLSAGEYRRLPGRGSAGSHFLAPSCCIVVASALKGANDGYFVRLKRLLLFLASFLSLCRSSAPDSSRAFVSIRVTGTCEVARSAERYRPPGVYEKQNGDLTGPLPLCSGFLWSPCLATGSPGLSLCQEAVLLLVDISSEPSKTDTRLA